MLEALPEVTKSLAAFAVTPGASQFPKMYLDLSNSSFNKFSVSFVAISKVSCGV